MLPGHPYIISKKKNNLKKQINHWNKNSNKKDVYILHFLFSDPNIICKKCDNYKNVLL